MSSDLLRMSEFKSSTPIQIRTPDGIMELSVADAKQWICPDAPIHVIMQFLIACRVNGLDPFARECYPAKIKDKWTLMYDKSGWLHRAERHPDFDGFSFGIMVRRFNAKEMRAYGPVYEVEGAYLEDDCILVGGWARVYRKDRRHPSVCKLSMQEGRQSGGTWDTIPCTMIAKSALVQALRHSGLVFEYRGYDKHEFPPQPGVQRAVDDAIVTEAIEVEYSKSPVPSLSPDLMVKLMDVIRDQEIPPSTVDRWCQKRGVASVADLTDAEAQKILIGLGAMSNPKAVGEAILPDPKPAPPIEAEVVTDGGEVITDDLPPEERERLLAQVEEVDSRSGDLVRPAKIGV